MKLLTNDLNFFEMFQLKYGAKLDVKFITTDILKEEFLNINNYVDTITFSDIVQGFNIHYTKERNYEREISEFDPSDSTLYAIQSLRNMYTNDIMFIRNLSNLESVIHLIPDSLILQRINTKHYINSGYLGQIMLYILTNFINKKNGLDVDNCVDIKSIQNLPAYIFFYLIDSFDLDIDILMNTVICLYKYINSNKFAYKVTTLKSGFLQAKSHYGVQFGRIISNLEKLNSYINEQPGEDIKSNNIELKRLVSVIMNAEL